MDCSRVLAKLVGSFSASWIAFRIRRSISSAGCRGILHSRPVRSYDPDRRRCRTREMSSWKNSFPTWMSGPKSGSTSYLTKRKAGRFRLGSRNMMGFAQSHGRASLGGTIYKPRPSEK
jgi:hypothetical protein